MASLRPHSSLSPSSTSSPALLCTLLSLLALVLLSSTLAAALPRFGGRPNFHDWVRGYRPEAAQPRFNPNLKILAPRKAPEHVRNLPNKPSKEQLAAMAQFGGGHTNTFAAYPQDTGPMPDPFR